MGCELCKKQQKSMKDPKEEVFSLTVGNQGNVQQQVEIVDHNSSKSEMRNEIIKVNSKQEQNPLKENDLPEPDKVKKRNKSEEEEEELISDELLIDEKFVRQDEKGIVRFSKLGIITFINKLLVDINWELLYDENDITLFISKDGSPLAKEFLMAKTTMVIRKKDYRKKLTIEFLYDLMFNPLERKKYDTNIKVFHIFEETVREHSYVYRLAMKSPVFFISERDGVNKKINFMHNDGMFYYASSIDDDYFPPQKEFVRIKNIVSFFHITEDEHSFTFSGFGQIDPKMAIPQFFLKITMPYIIRQWYKTMNDYIEKITKEEEEKGSKVI